jgi:hypothetical protein
MGGVKRSESDRKSQWNFAAADEAGKLPGKLKTEATRREPNRQQDVKRPKRLSGSNPTMAKNFRNVN